MSILVGVNHKHKSIFAGKSSWIYVVQKMEVWVFGILLFCFNKALIAKQCGRILHNPNSLVAQMLQIFFLPISR